MKQQNSQRPYRALFAELATEPVVTPLSGPSYGPFNVARRRWRKPLPAIIADALANNVAIITRLKLGIYSPDPAKRPQHEEVFNQLCRCTDAQIAALQAFAAIDWRE